MRTGPSKRVAPAELRKDMPRQTDPIITPQLASRTGGSIIVDPMVERTGSTRPIDRTVDAGIGAWRIANPLPYDTQACSSACSISCRRNASDGISSSRCCQLNAMRKFCAI